MLIGKSSRDRSTPTPMLPASLLTLLLVTAAVPLGAGTYSGSEITILGADLIKHPVGYDGTPGALRLEVCLDPAAPDAAEIPLQKAIEVWGAAMPTTGNTSAVAGVPAGEVDFFSEMLRGIGLCLGLDDPSDELGFTRANEGRNDVFDRDSGLDSVTGTADDERFDDVNRTWFRIADNNPFDTTPGVVDSTTYSRDVGLLPEGQNFPACATRVVALSLAAAGTESVMVRSLATGEARRSLTHDDVATLAYANSGLDELAGTGDDYTPGLAYIGRGTSCDIPVSFTSKVGASERMICLGGNFPIESNHYRFSSSSLQISDQVVWHYIFQGGILLDGFETGDASRWSSSTGF